MDRRRAAGLLLALAACIANATAAPTASNHTALDLYDGAPEGCYYNFQHYGEGDRIMTNEPCLNCTCHNRMLMCYLKVCPFTKPIGQDCTIEKRADQCCPIVTCPDVPVDLLTSTTNSPAEYGPTGVGKLDKFGCSINGKYFSEGSKVPPTPNKPCEHCYCIRNMTTCVMQECTLHVDGCTPIYHKDVCCPVRYSCDHPEDEMPLLDDLSTTVRPTPGFLLTTTTVAPVTQISQDCVYDNRIFPDGALIKTEKACDHCYCMKGDIVCVVQECGTPMENEGKNCTALPPREGVCCPDTYICEGDEPTTGTYETNDFTDQTEQDKLTTLTPPRRTSSEGSGYRNDDDIPYTELPLFEPDIDGSGEDEPKHPDEFITDSPTPRTTDDILTSTEEIHEFIPLTTAKPSEEKSEVSTHESTASSQEIEKTSESQTPLPATTSSIKKVEEPLTEKSQDDVGSGEIPEDVTLKPQENIYITPGLSTVHENVFTTELNEENIVVSEATERESQTPVTIVPSEDKKTTDGIIQDIVTSEETSTKLPIEYGTTSSSPTSASEDTTEQSKSTDDSAISSEIPSTLTTFLPITVKDTTEPAEPITVDANNDLNRETTFEPQHYHPSSSTSLGLDDEYITTESQEHDVTTETVKEKEYFKPEKHTTASTPMLEEIEKDTTEYPGPERIVPSSATQDNMFNIQSTTVQNDISMQTDESNVITPAVDEKYTTSKDYVPDTTKIPMYDQQEITTGLPHVSEISTEAKDKDYADAEQYAPSTNVPTLDDSGRRTTQFDYPITLSDDDSKNKDVINLSTTAVPLESVKVTTEPDKGLNTIPSDSVEKGSVSSDVQKTTVSQEEIITTESDLDTKIDSSPDSTTIPSKLTTISDMSISKDEPSTLTTESAFRKEDYTPSEGHAGAKITTIEPTVTEEVSISDQTKTTDKQHETITTLEPKYTESAEKATLSKETTDVPNYESSTTKELVTEKDLGVDVQTITSEAPQHKPSETTQANQEENEIFNEPRIPGEGDCLLNEITYKNESTVPSTNKCQSGCRCISSIIKCDPIICSAPPEYMNNCEAMYDTPDVCCPTYVCDHKTETIPPQSHSQMSGTEAPVISTVHCNGDECEIKKDDAKHHDDSLEACKSGSCEDSSNVSKETGAQLPPEYIPEQPTSDQKEKCSDPNNCQASPVTPCEGEKCVIAHDDNASPKPQLCADGKNCPIPIVPAAECTTGNCDATKPEPESGPEEKCTDKEGCTDIPVSSEQECNEENCKKKDDIPLDQQAPAKCTESSCEQTQTETESSTSILPSEQTSQDTADKDDKILTPVEVTEVTERIETPTESTQDIVTKQPEFISDETSTISGTIVEATTKVSESSDDNVPEKHKTGSPDLIPTTIKDYVTEDPFSNEITTQTPVAHITHEYAVSIDEQEIKTHSPQEFITTVTPIEITRQEDIQTPTKTLETVTEQAFETQKVTESTEKIKLEDTTRVSLDESSTETAKATLQPDEIMKPIIESENKDTSTEITKEIDESASFPTTFDRESSTEPDRTHITKPQESTEAQLATDQEEVSKSDQNITEPPKSLDVTKQEELITETPEISRTETPGSEDKTGKEGHTDTPAKPFDITSETSVTSQSEKVTSDNVEQYSSTVKTPADFDTEPPKSISSEPQDIPESPTTAKVIVPDASTEESDIKPSKTLTTESLDVTKSHEELDYEKATEGTEKSSDVPLTVSYTTEPYEITKSQDLDGDITVPPKTDGTQPQSFEKHEHGDVTVTQSSTEQNYATEEKSTEEYHEDITSKISEEPSTLPPRIDTTVHETTKHIEDIFNEHTTSEQPPKTFVTESQEVSELPNEAGQKETTSQLSEEPSTKQPEIYSTEPQKVTKSPGEIDFDATTMNILIDSDTEPSQPIETKPDEVSKPSEDVSQEGTTSKISQTTESYITGEKDLPTSPDVVIDTTTPALIEKVTEISKISQQTEFQIDAETEPPSKFDTESNIEIETSKPTVVEMFTEHPDKDEEKSSTETEIHEVTTSQESLISESVELTTPSSLPSSTVTTPQKAQDETESPPPKPVETESTEKEQLSTTSAPTDHDITFTETSATSDSQKINAEESPKPPGTELPDSEILSTEAPIAELTNQPGISQTLSTQQPPSVSVSEKDITKPIDTEVEVPAYIPLDELRTTPSESLDLTTAKPIDVSETLHDIETKTETPQEHDAEASTEKIGKGTEKPIDETISDFTKDAESQTVISPTSSEGKPIQEENYTEESTDKYSSPEPTDITKAYPNEEISTVESMFHESKEPQKPVDGLVQSLVTGPYEISTRPSDLEKHTSTEVPVQVSSEKIEIDTTQLSEDGGDVKEKITTLPSKLPDTTHSEFVETSTKYAKPLIEDEVRTESPSDKPVTETTVKENALPGEEIAVTKEPPASEQNEIITSTVAEHEFSTKRPEMTIPSDEVTTENVASETFVTEKQQSVSTDKPTDVKEIFTESSHLTERPDTMVTKIDESVQDQDHTEPEREVTRISDDETQKQTEQPSEISPTKSPAVSMGTETSYLEPISDDHSSISPEPITTESSDSSHLEPSTPKPSVDTESPAIDSTVTAAYEYPAITSSPTKDTGLTDKIKEEITETHESEGFTTEFTKVTESTHTPHLSEVYTDKQTETTQTIASEKETAIKDHLTTRKQFEPEIYQTTETIYEKATTRIPVTFDQESSTLDQGISQGSEHIPTDEQSIPVVITESEKPSTTEESIVAQTEKVIPDSNKPVQETTELEDEYILASSKATTAKTDEEISTVSPAEDSTTRLTNVPTKSPLTTPPKAPTTDLPETLITSVPEVQTTALPESPVMTATESLATSPPETIITKEPEAPGATSSEAPATIAPEAPTTIIPEAPTTTASEAPTTTAPEAPTTTAPEAPTTTARGAPTTTAPEAPTTTAPEAPTKIAPEAPTTTAPEAPTKIAPEAPTTTAPEAPGSAAPDASATIAPEAPATTVPEAPSTTAPEAPTKTAPESPTTTAPESPTTTALETPTTTAPEAPASTAPDAPATIAPEVSVSTSSEGSVTTLSEVAATGESEVPVTKTPELPITQASETPVTSAPELPKPVSTEAPPTDEAPVPDDEFPPSGGSTGYGQEPDYEESFGPGTCRYGGKVYVSAQQIPRDDPCDFCFCFRSDIICLQQSCPPPIHGCHEEPIQGFCCPRYECPVSMATTVNVTTTTTTTTTTLPPNFPTHSYKGSAQKRGCQIKGQTYKVGEVVRASSGPCLHCTCGGDGQMKCDPKVCTPEPMLRQMIAAAVSAKRRR